MGTRARGKHEDAAATRRFYFNDRKIQKEPIPEKTASAYDAKVPSLGLRLTPSGKRTFFWYRAVNGKLTWRTLGEHPVISVEVARGMAGDLDDKLKTYRKKGFAGANPFASPDVPDVLTLESLMELYISQHIMLTTKNPEKNAKSIREQFNWYLDDWKQKELGEITRKDVLARYGKLWQKVGGSTANHAIAYVRAIYKWAIDRELWVGKNPARLHKDDDLYEENMRSRYLSEQELVRVRDVAEEYRKGSREHRDLADFVLLSIACGQRKKTTMHARWETDPASGGINLATQTWKLLASETKNGEPFTVELSPIAVRILREREQMRDISPVYVFPGSRKDRSIDPKKPRFDFNGTMLKKFFKSAGLDFPRSDPRNFRIHDFRHTYVSYQVMAGRSLEQAGAAVGHADVKSTKRYAHLAQQVQRETVLAGEAEIERRVAAARKQLTEEASRA